MTKVFIDGSAGTTGLRIYDRLSSRNDISLIKLTEDNRKDVAARKEAINSADIAFLCLPDSAAIESVSLVENPNTAIIDTSTAHRTADNWTYGFPELFGKRGKIAISKRIANPGCHASGFIALVEPLVREGVINRDLPLNCFSVTGYSGGGKSMIAEYEAVERNEFLEAPRQYGLTQQHKHLKEMSFVTGLENMPVFCPVVAPFYSGMQVTVPLFSRQINGSIEKIKEIYGDYYNGKLVYFAENNDENGFLSSAKLSNKDSMEINVFGNDDRIILVARYDNLGKGASGSAVQNMNILMGVDETIGLVF